ncbi:MULTISPECIES: hypothetical protein [Parafrankia]|uniref:Uncharacterized protein n=1 Tax=Parafrankia soli TaxID=2599596 RepID=A0A1S1QV55_9ACTN|nr:MULTISPECIES: hypothetical protein [Parafrankia]OHV38593.1 hypothetical protein BBK14_14245 [Parafrankia soli]TCJ33164.1 hypothetical protein E0504_38545 [Parafrankia sp. BMG5.11]CAI7978903.1 conserved hypothetical protein [Frankia sp. Hr75.2]SQD94251.1 conserved hypothetical protein [Parafrankia sp. Ea1.12]
MTLVAAAVCPHPPLLVPQVAGVDPVEVRDHASAAVARLCALAPDHIVVVGDDAADAHYAGSAVGSLAGFGVDLSFSLGASGTGPAVLPLSLTIGAWLLREAGWAGRCSARGVPAATGPAAAAAIGADLVATAEADGSRLALLIMGDGSARRTVKAPGSLDPRAAAHDASVSAALATLDVTALLALDPALAADLLAPGRASWQVLAGALRRATPGDPARSWTSLVRYDDAPFGVGYLVVGWERADGTRGDRQEKRATAQSGR